MKEIEAKFEFLEKYFEKGVEIYCNEEGYLFEKKNTSKIWLDKYKFLEVGKKDKKIWIKSNKKDFLISLSIIITFKIYSENFELWINGEKIKCLEMWENIEEIIRKIKDLNIIEIEIEKKVEEEIMVWIVRPEYEDDYLKKLNEDNNKLNTV